MPAHDPLLLDEALETNPGSAVGVHHHLHQRGKEAAEVGSVLLWEGPQHQYKEAEECEVIKSRPERLLLHSLWQGSPNQSPPAN